MSEYIELASTPTMVLLEAKLASRLEKGGKMAHSLKGTIRARKALLNASGREWNRFEELSCVTAEVNTPITMACKDLVGLMDESGLTLPETLAQAKSNLAEAQIENVE